MNPHRLGLASSGRAPRGPANPPNRGFRAPCGLPDRRMRSPLLVVMLAVLTSTAAASVQDGQQRPNNNPNVVPATTHLRPAPDAYFRPYLGSGSRPELSTYLKESPEPPCSDPYPVQQDDDRLGRSPRRGPQAYLQGPLLPPTYPAAPATAFPYASPRSDDVVGDAGWQPGVAAPAGVEGGTRRGYYGHEVGYGSYFPIGLDPLTILAGLAFLAFIIQTLYLLLYKHYGLGPSLGLGVGAGAGVGIGPLSADRHQRDEQQAWANSIASRIDTTATTYEGSKGTSIADRGVSPGQDSSDQPQSTDSEADSQTDSQTDSQADSEAESAEAARRGRHGGSWGPSPLNTLLSLLQRSWIAPASLVHHCGPSWPRWLCRLVRLARILTEPQQARPAARVRGPQEPQFKALPAGLPEALPATVTTVPGVT